MTVSCSCRRSGGCCCCMLDKAFPSQQCHPAIYSRFWRPTRVPPHIWGSRCTAATPASGSRKGSLQAYCLRCLRVPQVDGKGAVRQGVPWFGGVARCKNAHAMSLGCHFIEDQPAFRDVVASCLHTSIRSACHSAEASRAISKGRPFG